MFRIFILICSLLLMNIIEPYRSISSIFAADYSDTKGFSKDFSKFKSPATIINEKSSSISSFLSNDQQRLTNIGDNSDPSTDYHQQKEPPQSPTQSQEISSRSLVAGPLYKMTDVTSQSSAQSPNIVQAAVQSKHEIRFRDYPITGSVVPTTVEVVAISLPLNILFKSASSSLRIHQTHEGSEGSMQETASEDQPHRLLHSVKKPIVQEVYEVITPFRKITQEIHPVQEHIITVIARGNEKEIQGNNTTEFLEKLYDMDKQPKGPTISSTLTTQNSSFYSMNVIDSGASLSKQLIGLIEMNSI